MHNATTLLLTLPTKTQTAADTQRSRHKHRCCSRHWWQMASFQTYLLYRFSDLFTIHIYIYVRCIRGIFRWEVTTYTVIYGAYIRFWPTLIMCQRIPPTSYAIQVLELCWQWNHAQCRSHTCAATFFYINTVCAVTFFWLPCTRTYTYTHIQAYTYTHIHVHIHINTNTYAAVVINIDTCLVYFTSMMQYRSWTLTWYIAGHLPGISRS